jgi:hypothetical protein
MIRASVRDTPLLGDVELDGVYPASRVATWLGEVAMVTSEASDTDPSAQVMLASSTLTGSAMCHLILIIWYSALNAILSPALIVPVLLVATATNKDQSCEAVSDWLLFWVY